MNWIKKSSYLVPIIICVLGILGIAYYYFMGSFSKLSATEYVYIDDNDNLDSVCVKLEPIASDHGLSAFRMLARHGGYMEHIRSGRYAITPDQSTIKVFRNLKNGHQEPVKLTIPEGTQPGERFRIKGAGIPYVRSQNKGDLYVTVMVEVPKKLTDKQKEILRIFEESTTGKEYEKKKSFLDRVKDAFS